MGTLSMGTKGKLQVCLVRVYWPGVAGDRLTRGKVSKVIGEACILGFLWLSLSGKGEQKSRKLLVTNQALAILGRLLQKLLLSLLDCYKESNRVSSKSDLQQAGFLSQLLEITGSVPWPSGYSCESEFYFYRCAGQCLFVYSVSHMFMTQDNIKILL